MRYLAAVLIFAFTIATITKPTCSGGLAFIVCLWGIVLTLLIFNHDDKQKEHYDSLDKYGR